MGLLSRFCSYSQGILGIFHSQFEVWVWTISVIRLYSFNTRHYPAIPTRIRTPSPKRGLRGWNGIEPKTQICIWQYMQSEKECSLVYNIVHNDIFMYLKLYIFLTGNLVTQNSFNVIVYLFSYWCFLCASFRWTNMTVWEYEIQTFKLLNTRPNCAKLLVQSLI